AHSRHGINTDVLRLAGFPIEAANVAAITPGIDEVGVGGIWDTESRFTAAYADPVAAADAAKRQAIAWPRGGAEILHGATDTVRRVIVCRNVIELGDGQVRSR